MLFRVDDEGKAELGNLPRNKRKQHLKALWKTVTPQLSQGVSGDWQNLSRALLLPGRLSAGLQHRQRLARLSWEGKGRLVEVKLQRAEER